MAFKVFDLQCDAGHVFEGWFASHGDYESQHENGLLGCPVCSSKAITRRVSAPRLNVSGATQPPAPSSPETMQAELIRQVRAVLRSTENVGARFAEEARRIHEGDAPERPIRGTASMAEHEALVDDGIAVMPVPAIFDDDRLQ